MAEATLKVQGTNFFLHPLPSALKRLVKSVVAEKNNNLQKPHARSQYLKLAHVASEAPEPPKPKVAIVGAGIAGLYSAYILQELGVEYTIYEVSNRIGGRIKTHYFETQSGQAANAHPDGVATSAAAKNKKPSEVVPGKEDADNHSDKPDTDMKDSVAHKTRARSSSKAKLEEPQETKKVKHDDGKVDTVAAPVEVHGTQPAVSETYAELGAMRLPDVENHWRVFDLINRVGLTSSVIPFKMSADQKNSFVYINKTALRKNDPRSSDVADLQFPKNIADLWKGYHSLQKEDGSKLSADDIVDKIIQPFIEELSAGDPTSDDIQSKKLLANDFHSLESYLREKLKSDFFIPAEKLEPFGLLSFLDIMACSTGLFELSLSEFVIDAWQFSGASNWSTIKGGMSRMVNNLGSKLTNQNVHLGCKVTKVNVDKSTNKSQLTYIENGTLKTTAFYDHVIVTVPLPVLRHIQFVSPSTKDVLGYEKREAIRDFGYDHSCKIFLRFNTRWWEKAPFNIVGGSSTTDLPNRVVVYPSYGQDLPDGVLLASYTWGTDAVRWAGLSESDRLHQALENIVEMHTALVTDPALAKTIEQEIRNSFNGGQSICWTNEPQSLGAFSYLYPSQFGRMQEVVNAPVEGIVHFAGEHADIYHAWIAASLNSAYRAVKQVVAKNTKLGDLLQEKFSKKNLLKTVTTASVAANMEAKNKTAPLMATEAKQHTAVPKKISLQSFSRYG